MKRKRPFKKLMMIILLMVVFTLSSLSFTSNENISAANVEMYGQIAEVFDGTWQPDGCYGEPLNCNRGGSGGKWKE